MKSYNSEDSINEYLSETVFEVKMEVFEEANRESLDYDKNMSTHSAELVNSSVPLSQNASLHDGLTSFLTLNQSISIIAEFKDLQVQEKRIVFGSPLPKEIKKKNLLNLMDFFNYTIVTEWRTIKVLEGKDIDVKVDFESEEEGSGSEIIYTFFIMDLQDDELESIWKELRKFVDAILTKIKREQPKYRRKIEFLEDLITIHIDW